jgi:nicotinamidase-related amidase
MATPFQPYYTGESNLLTPDNHALLLIDHQPAQLASTASHDRTLIINNVLALAKYAKAYQAPMLFTTVMEVLGGKLINQLQAVDPEQTPIARTTLNSWEDERVIEWVQETGKQKLVFAALWTEICLQFPVLSALGDGYEVYFITDASGGTTREAHDMAVQRMIQAGAVPDTLSAYGGSLIRDWARPLPPESEEISAQHGGILATDSQWERDLLFADPPEWMAQTH